MKRELLQRYVEGDASDSEVEDVVKWLDEDGEHVRELNALHRLYEFSLLNRPAAALAGARRFRLRWRVVMTELAKAAVVFIVAYFCAGLPDSGVKDSVAEAVTWQTLIVPAGQRSELILSDSTRIWVNAQSRMLYPSRFEDGRREVVLYGEAYFDVRHNADLPFVVRTSSADIEVKGTEFNVIADSARLRFAVSLLKGSIELRLGGAGRSILMKPEEHLELRDGRLRLSGISDFEYFRWKEGLLCFSNETVGAIIEKLQLYYDVRIEVLKGDLLGRRYSGKFRTGDGVEQVLRVLRLEHRFSYVKDNEHNLITIK